ncbi:MAG: hypothetical protein AB4352_18025 [Hormoscilla sp.]
MPPPRVPQLSKQGIKIAKEALTREGWSYEKLAERIAEKHDLTFTDQVVSRFLNGKRIDRHNFRWLCDELGLEVSEVAETLEELAPNPPKPSHPFDFIRGPVSKPEDFFGRTELLRQLFEELAKGSNISLLGPARVGKSSILKMICHWGPERLGLSPEQFINLDMQLIRDENEFFEALCDELKIETCRSRKLDRALRGQRYILCLDEIDKLTREEHFTGDERRELRALAYGADKPFSLVIASQKPLQDLFPDSSDRTSPLVGICLTMDVQPFSGRETRDFLSRQLQGTGINFTEDQIKALLKETEGYPARLQRAAADLYRRLSGGNEGKC